MKKIIKTYGNTLVITFDSEEQKIYNINAGDVFDVELSKVRKPNFTKQDLNAAYEETGAHFGVSE